MADNFLFTNNASALLAASINDTDTTVVVATGFGALFPNPTGSQEFRAALQDANGNLEIVKVTARSTDSMTIVRAQEGTVAQSWTLGVTRMELRLTEETMEEMLQKNGGTMAGDLDMNENNLVDPNINGSAAKMTAGQIVGVPLRGVVDDSSNEIAVPNDGSRATASGSAILTQADLASNGGLNLLPINSIIMWYGSLAALPTGWQLCNGSGGTPDLRGSFPRGAGGSIALGAVGGAATASGTTSSSGAHTHTGSAASHVLTAAEIPSHNHRLLDRGAGSGIADGSALTAVQAISGTRNVSAGSYVNNGTLGSGFPFVEETGGGGGHSHSVSINSDGAHTHTLSSISTIPPYVGVYFIMKVS